jgi:hypothetical protein
MVRAGTTLHQKEEEEEEEAKREMRVRWRPRIRPGTNSQKSSI